jgi:hypothetical protein
MDKTLYKYTIVDLLRGNGFLRVISQFLVFNTTFSNISALSWRPVVVVEEAGENHRTWASNWQTLSLTKECPLQFTVKRNVHQLIISYLTLSTKKALSFVMLGCFLGVIILKLQQQYIVKFYLIQIF